MCIIRRKLPKAQCGIMKELIWQYYSAFGQVF
jgi:hypothetical protein